MPSTPDATAPVLSPAEIAALLSALQVEVVGLKARTDSQQETIVNLMHENALLKRRIYGNKTERGNTEELQLTLGSLLDGDKQLQKQLDESVSKTRKVVDEDAEPAPKGPRPPPKGR